MARGASSQSTSSSTTRPGTTAPRGSAAAAAGMRRRRLSGSSSAAGGGGSGVVGSGNANNMLRFYTDDSPGLKISPTVVLVMSLCFIGFVTALHVLGKFYRYRSASGSGA
ncbi:Protein transport protein Sec61 subunit beta [Capsicum chinense]|nr:protein transport protein Sec61 subunit beta [Capsicum annuum]PHU14460.1 Protein transport protein Sec61 subunit beta [Capsicum chinense]